MNAGIDVLFSSRHQGVSVALGRQAPLEKIGRLSSLVGRIADERPVIGPVLGVPFTRRLVRCTVILWCFPHPNLMRNRLILWVLGVVVRRVEGSGKVALSSNLFNIC